MQKYAKKFVCKKCDYICTRKFLWNQHIVTKKHNDNKMIKNDNKYMHICHCGKSYKYQSGISRHKKKCPSIVVKSKCLEEVGNSNEVAFLKQKLLEKENENKELGNENKELVNKICAMAPKIGSNNISINVFLNEHCKNAMSLADFTNQIQLTLTDIVKTKQLGFAEGVSNILIKNLNELPSIQRPIHCSDTKRLKFYVKDEKGWNIDKCNKKVDTAIESIITKQMKELRKWEVNNPDYLENDEKLKAWQLMIHSIMGSSGDTERDRDSKNIMKNVGDNTALKDAMSDTQNIGILSKNHFPLL